MMQLHTKKYSFKLLFCGSSRRKGKMSKISSKITALGHTGLGESSDIT